MGVGRAQQLGPEGKLENGPRLLKVICHWARKTNSDQVLPRTGRPSLRSCSLLLPTEVSSFGLHRNLGGPIPPLLGKLSWLPGHTVSLFLGKLEQAKRAVPLFTATSSHHPVFNQEPSTNKNKQAENRIDILWAPCPGTQGTSSFPNSPSAALSSEGRGRLHGGHSSENLKSVQQLEKWTGCSPSNCPSRKPARTSETASIQTELDIYF